MEVAESEQASAAPLCGCAPALRQAQDRLRPAAVRIGLRQEAGGKAETGNPQITQIGKTGEESKPKSKVRNPKINFKHKNQNTKSPPFDKLRTLRHKMRAVATNPDRLLTLRLRSGLTARTAQIESPPFDRLRTGRTGARGSDEKDARLLTSIPLWQTIPCSGWFRKPIRRLNRRCWRPRERTVPLILSASHHNPYPPGSVSTYLQRWPMTDS